MPFIPIPNTARCEMRYTYQDQQVANVFHIESAGSLAVSDLMAMGEALVDWWGSMATIITNDVELREIDIRDLTTASGLGILYNAGLPISGGLAGSPLPNNVTVAIKWGTGLTGRSFRGRTYHIGITEAQVSGNALESAFSTSLLNGYGALPNLITTAGYTLVVASRYSNNQPRSSGVTTPILNAAYADVVIDSQRRRLPGRGR